MITRNATPTIKRLAEAFPVVAIVGPRQSGKTTIAKKIFHDHKYISFEEIIEAREEAEKDPHGFLNTYANEHGLILDEFQHVPSLLSYIQLYVDKNRKPGYFILTGSQNFLMNQAIAQTLAGRVALVTLLPLSITELENTQLLPDSIEEFAFKGTYPELYTNVKMNPVDWYQNYILTYLERDVRDLRRVESLSTFRKFMRLCAARVGQIINVTNLANDADIDQKTAHAWLTLLEASYIIFRVHPYYDTFTRRLVKTPKLFFYDTGLACSLLGIETVEQLKLSSYRGNLIESLIMSDIEKLYHNQGRLPRMYFLKDKNDKEIDCVIEKTESLLPIEIKAKMTASRDMFNNIIFWRGLGGKEEIKFEEGYLVYAGSETKKSTYGTFLSWKDIGLLKNVIFSAAKNEKP